MANISRFEIKVDGGSLSSKKHSIVRDKETGVLYYVIENTVKGGIGITPILDDNGKPVVEK